MTLNARSKARAAARLAAVQALYQYDMEETAQARLLDEFHQHRLGGEIDPEGQGERYVAAEVPFFDDVVIGVIARREEIDALLGNHLAANWNITRLDKTLLQILRAGAYELIARADVPTGAVIAEYLDVGHAFFDKRETQFLNGVLDAVAKAVR